MLLHTKIAAVSHLEEPNSLHAIENWMKSLIVQEGSLKTQISNQITTKFRSRKQISKKEHQSEAF